MSILIPALDFGAALRESMLDNMTRSPHDFLREPPGFILADQQVYIQNLMREIQPTDDLRFVYDDRLAVLGERLPWDCNFFGYEVARLHGIFPLRESTSVYTEPLQQWISQVQRRGVKYLFASARADDLALVRALCACSFTLIETRVTFHRTLSEYDYSERFRIRPATQDDIPSLGETARNTINIYDRFHADPFILPSDADRLMVKWLEASINEGFADITVVPDMPSPAAFLSVRYHRENWPTWRYKLSQLVFSAVASSCKTWFARLMSEVCYLLKGVGAQHVFVTTQIANRATIRSCEKLGFRLGHGEHIFRIVF